jgi:Lecithin retinol acyltransferase
MNWGMTGQGEFSYGDHLTVRRPGFAHHGIYVSDDRVIDFGGYDLRARHRHGVRAVTLQQFARGGKVDVVRHPGAGGIFGPDWLPGPLPPERIVGEAERLAKIGFEGKFTLFGSNCEHFANWCETGNYFESLQTKKFFRAQAALLIIMILTARSSGRDKWWRITCWSLILTSAVAGYQRRRAPYKFWQGVERPPSRSSW